VEQWRSITGPLSRCGPQPAAVADEPFELMRLHAAGLGTTTAITLGHGRTVVVLLHQTDGGGACGWLRFMSAYANPRMTFLALDLCRYGLSACTKVREGTFAPGDQTDMVGVAVDHARNAMGAAHVVVMGASMGGSVALMSAARLSGIVGAVDLSGPAGWPGADVVRGGRALRVPVFVATARAEGDAEVAAARATVAQAPPGSTLRLAATGHGYELVNGPEGQPLTLGRTVLAWIEGLSG
jgi:pimeloyl-ACP methyl ester carboxylesterase